MSKKIQNCPICEMPAMELLTDAECGCRNAKCPLGKGYFRIEMWNRIRIAPDEKILTGQLIDKSEFAEVRNMNIEIQEWMNPKFPKGEVIQ